MSGWRLGATGRLLTAMGVTVAAMVLTSPALALEDPPHPTTGAAEGSTPLALRPSKPIELAPESSHASTGWKALAILLVLGVGGYALRKRLKLNHQPASQLLIVRRAAIGFRSELLVVNVEGQRLLLGVTPHSIQSLAILDGEEQAAAVATPASAPVSPESKEAIRAAAPAAAPTTAADLGARFAAMLRTAEGKPAAPAAEAKSLATSKASATNLAAANPEPEIATQARGLMSLRRR